MAKTSSFETLSTGVFQRTGIDTISSSLFYFALAISLVWGLGLTAGLAYWFTDIGYKPGSWDVIGIMVLTIIGAVMSAKSDNPIVSFIGYNFIVIPFSALLGPYANQYEPNIVFRAFMLTSGITLVMGAAGTLWPRLFAGMGGVLFVSLCGLLVVRIMQAFIPGLDFIWIDYAAAGLFSLYIGYDMYRAHVIPRTLDNAIDVAIQLYLDIMNLFLLILRIMGRKR